MPVTNKYPTGDVNIGTVKFGATISAQNRTDTFFLSSGFPAESIYNIDCKLTITIADNANYNNADVYDTEFVESGTTVEIEHAITSTGTYYIKMVVEDKEGVTDTTEYTITAIQTVYFLEKPSIKTQSPKANKVTVRVKDSDPVIEATASTSPNADEVIERLIIIDDGDSTLCQNIADELLNRWSVEQKSITGKINLTVTLKFGKKVKIIAPDEGINENMVLQKKEHDATGRTTTITCGDIILSDDELLARILDDLGV